LIQGEVVFLGSVHANGNDDFVEKGNGPLYNVSVSNGDRVE
jgi:hypothetical protein